MEERATTFPSSSLSPSTHRSRNGICSLSYAKAKIVRRFTLRAGLERWKRRNDLRVERRVLGWTETRPFLKGKR